MVLTETQWLGMSTVERIERRLEDAMSFGSTIGPTAWLHRNGDVQIVLGHPDEDQWSRYWSIDACDVPDLKELLGSLGCDLEEI